MIGSDRRGLFFALKPNEPEEKKLFFAFSPHRARPPQKLQSLLSVLVYIVCVCARFVRPEHARASV